MKIIYYKKFNKRYKKLPSKIQQKIQSAIIKFENNPEDPRLKNHSLTGKLRGLRSFSVTGDIRIVFEEKDHYLLVIMLDVGTHNQVYK